VLPKTDSRLSEQPAKLIAYPPNAGRFVLFFAMSTLPEDLMSAPDYHM